MIATLQLHRTQWWAVSAFSPQEVARSPWMPEEARMVHAKRLGTELTACGRRASTWHKHWTPFDGAFAESRCAECSDAALHEARAARTPPSRSGTGDG